jgi:thiamine-monophosphate kinase
MSARRRTRTGANIQGRAGGGAYNRGVRVTEIGEFGLIRELAAEFGIEYPPRPGGRQPGFAVGLGDDALVGERRDGAPVWTTDTLVEGVHFRRAWASWEDVGWKALAVNVSDIGAMGATPDAALVTLCLPDDAQVDDLRSLYRGMVQAAEAWGVRLGGGDLVRSPVFVITLALSGWAPLSATGMPLALTRSAARPGHAVAVTGTLGDSAAGLELLQRHGAPASATERRLMERHLRPRPPLGVARKAIEAGLRCAIDISDGLAQDMGHVARASAVGIRVEAARIPLSEALRKSYGARALGLALGGGEDYELALIGPRPALEALRSASGDPLTEIGEVLDYDGPRVAVVDENGREVAVGVGGWEHFRASGA